MNSLVSDLGLPDDFFLPNRGKKLASEDDYFTTGSHLKSIQQQHRDFSMKRQNREFLNNLSKHQNHDTFYTSRGRKRFQAQDTTDHYDNVTDKIGGLLNEVICPPIFIAQCRFGVAN